MMTIPTTLFVGIGCQNYAEDPPCASRIRGNLDVVCREYTDGTILGQADVQLLRVTVLEALNDQATETCQADYVQRDRAVGAPMDPRASHSARWVSHVNDECTTHAP